MIQTQIEVVKAGLLTTIQDLGRYEGMSAGIPQSGVMDQFAFKMANALVGNAKESPVIEATFGNVEYLFNESGVVAITGAEVSVKINNCEVRMWESYRVNRGDYLTLGNCIRGCRNYIAMSGLWQLGELTYGSYSNYLRGNIGGLDGSPLKKGDKITTHWDGNCKKRILKSTHLAYFHMLKTSEKKVRVTLGPQEEAFSEQGINCFFNSGYKVLPQSDRMGIRLNGKQIGHILPADIISDGIAFGAIQVPSDGQPIIMMADRQTTGGYTKIGTVISADLPILAQAVKDDVIYFEKIMTDSTGMIKNEWYNEDPSVGENVLETYYYAVDILKNTAYVEPSDADKLPYENDFNKKNFHVMVEVLDTHEIID